MIMKRLACITTVKEDITVEFISEKKKSLKTIKPRAILLR